MAFLIGGANTLRDTGYNITNSLRFDRGDTPALSYSFSSTAASWTVSCWIKLGEISINTRYPFGFGTAGTDAAGVSFASGDSMAYYDEDGNTLIRDTAKLVRDGSAWYHMVAKNSSGTVTIYLNNIQQATGSGGEALDGSTFYVGRFAGSTAYHWDGHISEFYFIDGTAYSPSTFAETDSDSGIWKPKEADVTFGSDGFFMEFKQTGTDADSSGIGADTSGNDNHMTVTNLAATDVTEDTPTNNFATLMPTKDITLSKGNLIMSHNRDYWDGAYATVGLTSGKWYWEHRLDDADGDDRRIVGGIVSNPETYLHIYDGKGTTADLAGDDYGAVSAASPSYMYTSWATNLIFDGTSTYNNNFVDIDDDDVLSFALDLDNNKFFIAVNGSYIAGDDGGTDGDPAAGTNETFGILAASTSRVYFPAAVVGWSTNTSSTTASFNFGNPSFAISSGNADANGYGNFEYAVPSGFYSICTKNLAEHG